MRRACLFAEKVNRAAECYKYLAPTEPGNRSLNRLELFPREFVFNVARVERRSRFEEHDFAFLFSERSMLDAARDDDEFALLNPLFPIVSIVAIIHAKAALHHEEHLIFIFVMVPGEQSLELDELYELTV